AARQALVARTGPWRPALGARTEALTPEAVAAVPPRPGFAVLPEGTTTLPPPTADGAADSPAAAAFRDAARVRQAELAEVATAGRVDALPAPRLALGATAATVLG